MRCSNCGGEYDDRMVAVLDGLEDVAVCRDCLERHLERIGVSSTPTLPVLDVRKAMTFYKAAGFGVRMYDDESSELGFAFVDFDGQSVFDLALVAQIDPAKNGAGCYIITKDVDLWHARMSAAGLPVTPVQMEPWGMREFTLTDPSGNHLRIGHGTD